MPTKTRCPVIMKYNIIKKKPGMQREKEHQEMIDFAMTLAKEGYKKDG